MDGDSVVGIVFFASVPFTVLAWFRGKAYLKKAERDALMPSVPSEVIARLDRMEQGIDAIAVEVERISEGQRFTTKLLAEKGSPAALGAQGSN